MKGNGGVRPGNANSPETPKSGLTSGAFKGLLWMVGGKGIGSILKIAVLIILARLLVPEEFGVVSAALTVVALADTVGRVGVAPAIIQTKELTDDHLATGFSTTIVMGLVLACIVYFFAGYAAHLYRMPEVRPLIEAFSALFVIKSIGSVSEALLQRRLRFPELSMVNLGSYSVGYAGVGVTLAFLGYGAWALVLAQIAQSLIQSLLFLFLGRADLRFGFNWPIFLSIFRFGMGMTITRFGNFVSQNVDYMIVGRFLGAEALGFYSRSYLLLKQATDVFGSAGDQVLFPTLSTIQDDPSRLQRAMNLALSLTAMVQIPATAFLIATGPEIVFVLMGPQWDAIVLPFQILIGMMFFQTGYRFVNSVLRAVGMVYVAAAWQWAFAGAVALGALVGQDFGIEGVAIGVSVALVFCYFLGLAIVNRKIAVSTRQHLKRLVVYVFLGAVGFGTLLLAKQGLINVGFGSHLILVILLLGYSAIYLALFAAVPKTFGAEGAILREQALRAVRRIIRRKAQ